ncbi:MAG: EAL domain-containing protein [Oscillospiraceae bacterium]|nr:EAL domain-containing protein [Oscillospiraceae bacterium]
MSENSSRFRPSVEKRRILLVEDEFINQEILGMYLRDDYEVVPATTGTEALNIIHDQFDTLSLILLDLNLPDIHGLDVLREVKSDNRYARLPVIVMTADGEAEVECLTLGAIDFIPKPYPRQEVVLARVLRTVELSEDRDILRWTERDQLTGLYNKDFFYRYAVSLDAHHKDSSTDAIFMNIDHFHTINDRYGKSCGDDVLRRVGEKALEMVQETGGIACRSEADTFLIYCPHRDDYDSMQEQVSVYMNEAGTEHSENRIRVRMGVYSGADKSLDIERRFDRAKFAADNVKGSFTGSIGIYDDSMHDKEMLEAQLVEDFPRAIREKQFEVYYQPKFDVRPDKPVLSSAEALVRWNHPQLGTVSPGVFIPLFEKNGLLLPLDSYVWSQAASQIRDWKDRLGISLPVSVNVSRIDLYEPKLVELFQDITSGNGLDHRDLLLEITESAYTEDSEQIVEKVRQLRKIGFRIEMDDFGSGYSSLNMLSTLPIDALKLDMYFIRNAFKERKDTRLLEAMIQLAESFEVPTIAEGVETAEQVFTLKSMGCDIIQGYYFSRPIPAAEFEKFMLENKPEAPKLRAAGKKPHSDRFTYNALHDSLTGLYNYSAFDILFHDSDHDHIAVLIAQIDGYDAFRREKGRGYADNVILRVADVLRNSFRSVDHICRLREDEFAVIMTRVTDEEKALVSSKIEQVSRALSEAGEDTPAVSLSVGVAFPDRKNPVGNVFEDADAALCRLKETGKTGCLVF